MSGTLPAGLINWQCTPSQLEVKPKSTGNLLTTREDRPLEIGVDGHSKAAEDEKALKEYEDAKAHRSATK
jgi:hypothetical protein